MHFLLVFLGGGLGSCLRYGARLGLDSQSFPYATLAVNILGSFAAGWILHHTLKQSIAPGWKLFLMTGVLGGFTTFSAFSGETIELLVSGRQKAALANICASLVLCLLAAAAGFSLAGPAHANVNSAP